SGGTTLGVSGAVTGTGAFTSNAGGAGSGQVTLDDALSGFGGTFTTGGGVTHLSSLAFAATRPNALTLGYGTLHYTGTGETLAGAHLNPGASKASILEVDNDLTLRSMSVGTGGLIKKGAGDLVFKGNGLFELGNIQVDYNADKAQGITPTGESPNNAVTGTLLADGRLVIGTKGDDSDAPYVTTAHHITLGGRTTDWNSWANGVCEKAGELVLNNGFVDMRTSLWMGYYCGVTGSTDPANPPHGKLTVNGGVFSATAIEMLRDWQGYQTIQAEIEQNGGVIRATATGTSVSLGHQIATNGATAKITINDGLFDVAYDVLMGNAANTGPGTFIVNGGEVRCGHYFRVGNNATAGRQELRLNGGVLTCMHLDHVGADVASGRGSAAVYFNGGVLKLGHNRTLGWGSTIGSETKAANRFPVYVGARGAIFDFTEWEKAGADQAGVDLRLQFLHDPDCAGADGGITFRGRSTVSFRWNANGSTFNGPIRLEDRFALSIDNGWTGYLTTPVICGQGTSLRISGNTNTINTVTLGEAGGTAPVILDFCADRADVGLFTHTKMEVLSPVTVAFHRPGGAYNIHGMQDGTYNVVYYKPADEADVPLEMFVANTNFPEKAFSYVKENVTSGVHAGMRTVKVTISPTDAAATVWTSVTAGGDWHDAANWNGGQPPDGTNSLALFNPATAANVPVNVDDALTVGTATLKGADAGAGYTIAGGAVNLNHRDFKTAPGLVVASGTHVIAADLTTDDYYRRSNETDANGGHTGAIGVYTASGATARVTGTLTMDPNRPLRVNTPKVGGGKTTFEGTIAQGSGVWVNSGTLELADMSKLNGKTLTVGPGTFHYTGPEAISSAKVVTRTDGGSQTAIIRLDNDLLLTDRFDSQMGGLMKTGPGTLTLSPSTVATATNHLGWYGFNTSWNNTGANWYWPDNGDCSAKQGAGGLCIDEGEIVVAGGPNALFHVGNNGNGLDCFVGANDRGWGYATNYAALTIRSGTVKGGWIYLGHTFNRGKDAGGNLIPTYAVYNQYGGNATFASFCFCYDLSDYDTAVQATANLYGGTLSNTGPMRFGQTYNKTGVNPPHATFNVYGGTYNHLDMSGTKGTRMGYLGGKADGEKTLNRACDATLNMYGGFYNETNYIYMGCNGSTSRLNLHGGILKAEKIFLSTSTSGNYCFFAGGSAYIYWNGGMYAPVGTAAADRTLTDLTEVLVSTNGAVVTTEYLAGDTYTIAQPLLHDPALEGTDGGFVKKGAKPLALTGANTYTGDTVIEEGTLSIPVGADASALPSGSAIVVA
ncbi:MAG: autotransporter-associated beta strand repeat-containing protein, partial [Kiritimatiellae bacterium]|nr:autotransporter-associated beta strand repeat-containing protein [Kiritimatiellia bacterium]